MSSYQHCFDVSIHPRGLWPPAFGGNSGPLLTLDLPPATRGHAFDNLIWPHFDTYIWPHLINNDACPDLRFQPGRGAGEGTAFEFLPLPSAIEAASYDALSAAPPRFCES